MSLFLQWGYLWSGPIRAKKIATDKFAKASNFLSRKNIKQWVPFIDLYMQEVRD